MQLFEVDIQMIYDHRVFVKANSAEEAEEKAYALSETSEVDKMFEGSCCEKEFRVTETWNASSEVYMGDSDDIMFIDSDDKLKSKEEFGGEE